MHYAAEWRKSWQLIYLIFPLSCHSPHSMHILSLLSYLPLSPSRGSESRWVQWVLTRHWNPCSYHHSECDYGYAEPSPHLSKVRDNNRVRRQTDQNGFWDQTFLVQSGRMQG